MKVFLAQQNYTVGDFQNNVRQIVNAVNEARLQGGELIVFSELAVCGYFPGDLLKYDGFVQSCLSAIEEIRLASEGIGILVGAPAINIEHGEKKLFNSAYFLYNKEILGIIHKTLLPDYDIFDESRYFEPAKSWECISFKGKKLAVTICEDIWHVDSGVREADVPMEWLKHQSPDIIINLSASPFDYTHTDKRLAVVKGNVERYRLPLIYCNAVGAQTDIIFDGGSMIWNGQGELVSKSTYFSEELIAVDWGEGKDSFSGAQPFSQPFDFHNMAGVFQPDYNIDKIYTALVFGIREYFQKNKFTKAVIGSSGGLDSAVVLALTCKALGPENTHAVLMPSDFSSIGSIEDARQLSVNLGNQYDIVPISNAFNIVQDSLKTVFKDLPVDVTEENIQARIRGLFLMAISNKLGSILLNTSNKSELAVGYGTLYGDMTGGLSVLGDVYKTQVYALAKYINAVEEIIPVSIINKPPSAELRPDQKDSDSLPNYAELDPLLFQHIDNKKDSMALIADGFNKELVLEILEKVRGNEYKRQQFCPIIRVSPKAFGSGRRMPVISKYL